MCINISLISISSYIPPSIGNISNYNLRKANDIQTIDLRANIYYNSFLPSVIQEWNNLSTDTPNSSSVNSIKNSLNTRDFVVPKQLSSANNIHH